MCKELIVKIASKYRNAIEAAYRKNKFNSDICFKSFPTGCCGDTSYLLAEYLHRAGIETIWCSAQRGDCSHAWLVVKNDRIKRPKSEHITYPEEVCSISL